MAGEQGRGPRLADTPMPLGAASIAFGRVIGYRGSVVPFGAVPPAHMCPFDSACAIGVRPTIGADRRVGAFVVAEAVSRLDRGRVPDGIHARGSGRVVDSG